MSRRWDPWCFKDSSVSLSKIRDCLRCSSPLLTLVFYILSHYPPHFHFGPTPDPSISCRSLWPGSDFVHECVWISVDVHAPTMTTPRVTNCCSHRTFIDKCRMVPTPSRPHVPRAAAMSCKSAVRISNSMEKRIMKQHCLTGRRYCSVVHSFAT